MSHWYKWLLVTLMSFEILTATGITFGWSALSLALRRDRVYFELCEDPSDKGECDAVELQLGLIYSAGAISLPAGITIFGFVMDRYGSVVVRLIGCFLLVVGSVLFALCNSVTFDAYVGASLHLYVAQFRLVLAFRPLFLCPCTFSCVPTPCRLHAPSPFTPRRRLVRRGGSTTCQCAIHAARLCAHLAPSLFPSTPESAMERLPPSHLSPPRRRRRGVQRRLC